MFGLQAPVSSCQFDSGSNVSLGLAVHLIEWWRRAFDAWADHLEELCVT
jgi:hypothetical protein